jgi:hypothetical protein
MADIPKNVVDANIYPSRAWTKCCARLAGPLPAVPPAPEPEVPADLSTRHRRETTLASFALHPM